MITLLRAITPGLASPPAIERSTIAYIGNHPSHSAIEVHPAEVVATGSSKPAHVFELKDIDFWGRYGGCVVTAENKLLGDLSPDVWGIENHAIFSQLRLPELQHLAGRTAIAVTPEAAGNYYHWLVDLLPRLALLKKTSGGVDSFARILINGSRARYEEESLEGLGMPREKILYVDAQHRFRIESAIIPSMDHACQIIAPWKIRALRGLRDVLAGDCRSCPPRLYISRRNAAVRRVLNEELVQPLLEDAGFAVVEPESLPWEKQMQMFANAEVILAPHGAALANIAFCKPQTLIAEISTRAGYKDFYLRLAASASLQYRVLEAKPRIISNRSKFRADENQDMLMDESALAHFLRDL